MKETAIEWLVEQFDTTINYTLEEYQLKIEQAKAMEKEQIINAWHNGFANGYDLGKYNDECSTEDAEQYYNETYESQTNI